MLEVYGDRPVVLVRELTKIYEEYQRGRISELIDYLAENSLKGECLLIVAGASLEKEDKADADLLAEIDNLVQSGSKKNQAIKVAKNTGVIRVSSMRFIMKKTETSPIRLVFAKILLLFGNSPQVGIFGRVIEIF